MDPAFAFSIQRTEERTPTAVFWITGRQRETVQRYGQVMWLDGKWGGGNTLRWPTMAMAVLNEELRLCIAANAFVCAETSDAYKCVIFYFCKVCVSKFVEHCTDLSLSQVCITVSQEVCSGLECDRQDCLR